MRRDALEILAWSHFSRKAESPPSGQARGQALSGKCSKGRSEPTVNPPIVGCGRIAGRAKSPAETSLRGTVIGRSLVAARDRLCPCVTIAATPDARRGPECEKSLSWGCKCCEVTPSDFGRPAEQESKSAGCIGCRG
jgi:hypothetical protein